MEHSLQDNWLCYIKDCDCDDELVSKNERDLKE